MPQPLLPTAAEPLPTPWVERIFDRLAAQLGAKVADMWAGTDPQAVKAEWAEALGGFRDEELRRGVVACRDRVFAPTLGEFRRLCRPALDPEVGWIEATAGLRDRDAGRMGAWSHPAVWRAACAMPLEVRTGTYAQQRKRWAWELEREFAAGWGDGVPAPTLQIASDVRTGPPSGGMRERIDTILRRAGRRGGVA